MVRGGRRGRPNAAYAFDHPRRTSIPGLTLEQDPHDRPSGQEDRTHGADAVLLERHAVDALSHILVCRELIALHAVIRLGCSG
jgi:hypothetical protein